MSARVDWIAVDWGTSHLRVWVLGADGAVLGRYASEAGMGRIHRAAYEAALLDLVAAVLPPSGQVPVICCGMAGSRQGWAEAPYRAVPAAPLGAADAANVSTTDPRLAVRLLPGLRQDAPADVMRGEETQVAGVLASRPDFDGVICLPGTHSKWVHVSAGEVVSFRTYLTGEMFALLSDQSILRHSVAVEGWDDAAFAAAVEDGMAHPARLSGALFSLRAEALLHGLAPQEARARLSGLLIGMELAAARPYWLGREVLLVGADRVAQRYRAALAHQGVRSEVIEPDGATLAGLAKARAALFEVAT